MVNLVPNTYNNNQNSRVAHTQTAAWGVVHLFEVWSLLCLIYFSAAYNIMLYCHMLSLKSTLLDKKNPTFMHNFFQLNHADRITTCKFLLRNLSSERLSHSSVVYFTKEINTNLPNSLAINIHLGNFLVKQASAGSLHSKSMFDFLNGSQAKQFMMKWIDGLKSKLPHS